MNTTLIENRKANTNTISTLRRRWTDAELDLDKIDAQSVAFFSELAIQELQARHADDFASTASCEQIDAQPR